MRINPINFTSPKINLNSTKTNSTKSQNLTFDSISFQKKEPPIEYYKKILNKYGIETQKPLSAQVLILSHYKQPENGTFKELEPNFDENELFKLVISIKGDADFSNSEIKSLENLLLIEGDADFSQSKVEDIGNLKMINGNACFIDSKIKDLKDLHYIGGNLELYKSKITSLKNISIVTGDVNLYKTKVKDLGKLSLVGGGLFLADSKVKDTSNVKKVKGNFQPNKYTNDKETERLTKKYEN